MTVLVSVRFEVFKRDRFTCSYCGKHPPEVLLEADHIIPLAAGGSSDLANLTTACTDCNRGKGARLLEEGTGPAINRAAVAEMHERVEQAQAYMESLGTLNALTDQQVGMVYDAWAHAYGATAEERDNGTFWTLPGEYGKWPQERSVRHFLAKLSLADVLDAVTVTAARIHRSNDQACRYFYGVCHGRIRDLRRAADPPTDRAEIDVDTAVDLRNSGKRWQNWYIGNILRNYTDHGYETLADAVLALFPDPD